MGLALKKVEPFFIGLNWLKITELVSEKLEQKKSIVLKICQLYKF